MCALLLVVGCAGVRSEAPQGEQEHTEATNEQAHSPEATASEDERCSGTRSFHRKNYLGTYVTNDLPGCPKGGLLSGTDNPDKLDGKEGDDEIRGLGGSDHYLDGGPGNDIIYGGDGDDDLHGFNGEDVLYGGEGNDLLTDYYDEQWDKLYCGDGRDEYVAVKNDYVDSSCEKKVSPQRNFGGEA